MMNCNNKESISNGEFMKFVETLGYSTYEREILANIIKEIGEEEEDLDTQELEKKKLADYENSDEYLDDIMNALKKDTYDLANLEKQKKKVKEEAEKGNKKEFQFNITEEFLLRFMSRKSEFIFDEKEHAALELFNVIDSDDEETNSERGRRKPKYSFGEANEKDDAVISQEIEYRASEMSHLSLQDIDNAVKFNDSAEANLFSQKTVAFDTLA